MALTTTKEGVLVVRDEQGTIIGMVVKDEASRKSVFHAVSEMGFEEIEELLKK